MGWLTHNRYETEFEAETERLAGVAVGLAPQSPVPTCPEWTVRDLVTHVGRGHRTATELVAGRQAHLLPFSTADAPDDPAAWPGWLAAGARGLAETIREVGPGQQVWTWQADRTAGFWLRRMLHDELIHRFDVELTAGRLGPVAPDLAADGVSDILETVATLSRSKTRTTGFTELAGAGETLRFVATDHATEWVAERTPDGVTWRHDGAADVTVRAPARELLLVLNRRLDPGRDEVEVTGASTLFHHWLEHSRF
jgi:uncharacterized protein (TIGR03083 family)